ncbi:MAG: hypothetical protein WCC32_18430 [Terriglobales bacterium]
MKRKYFVLAMGALVAMGAVLSLPSCGHDQKLESVQIQPQTFTFLTATAGQTEQLTATGTYIHPPATKDVTDLATWTVDDGVVEVGTNTGLITTVGNGACGGANITATVPEGTGGAGNIVSAYATVTVDDPTNKLCPGGGQVANLSVGITGNGSVASVPVLISCPGECVEPYDVGASVLLTATPAGGTAVTWAGCDSQSGNNCTVTIASGGSAVLATFQ